MRRRKKKRFNAERRRILIHLLKGGAMLSTIAVNVKLLVGGSGTSSTPTASAPAPATPPTQITARDGLKINVYDTATPSDMSTVQVATATQTNTNKCGDNTCDGYQRVLPSPAS